MAVGLDFGTTNSSIALAGPNGVQVAKFSYTGGLTESFRSLLYLDRIREKGRSTIKSWSGPRVSTNTLLPMKRAASFSR